jgi:spoIIIJ-associated protein
VESETWAAGDGDELASAGSASAGAASGPDRVEDAAAFLKELLEKVVDGIGVDADVAIRVDGDTLIGEYVGEDLGPVIGHHGQTIDAIQHLAYRIIFRRTQRAIRVVVDAAGYRERRAVALRATADQAAETAIHDGRPVALEAMSALERKVVHEHLKTRHDVETYSEGQEPERRLVVAPLVH